MRSAGLPRALATSLAALLFAMPLLCGCGGSTAEKSADLGEGAAAGPALAPSTPRDRAEGAPPAGEAGAGRGAAAQRDLRGTSRIDGELLAEAAELEEKIRGALPENFPADLPLGNWLSVVEVRKLGPTDFVVSFASIERREAVDDFFARTLPAHGWKLVSRSTKPVLNLLSYRKGDRGVTVMIMEQRGREAVLFDLAYKES